MTQTLHDIAKVLKANRQLRGLTQKELSDRVGIPQSHISKIETGTVDLKLSSLVEIARALQLELTLVPREALPAVESSVRAHDSASEARQALSNLGEQSRLAEEIKSRYPALIEAEDYQKAIRNVSKLQFGPTQLKSLELALKPTRQVQALLDQQGGALALAKRLREATAALQILRDFNSHQPDIALPRPAYSLEDEEP